MYTAVGIKGLFYDKLIGQEEPTDAIPPMPLHSTDHLDKFQTYISSYVINGFCGSLTEVMEIKGWVRSAAINDAVTTTTLNVLLPGIMSAYGAGQPVDTFFQLHQLGGFTSSAGNQEMKGVATLELQFWVPNSNGELEYAAGLMLDDTAFGFIAPITDMSLVIEVTKLNVDKVEILQCSWGKLNAVSVKLEINNGYRVIEPALNHFLKQNPINFPTNIFGIFELKALTLSYYDNYVYAGITPIFIGPTETVYEPEEEFYSIEIVYDQYDEEFEELIQ